MSDNIFKQAAALLDVAEVARYVGLTVRGGFVNCPFHQERTASCKLYKSSFFCFGCNASGDSISLAARVWRCGQFEALKRLNADFSLGLNLTKQHILRRNHVSQRQSVEQVWYRQSLDMLAQLCRKLGSFQCFNKELTDCEKLHQELLACEPQNAQLLLGGRVAQYERYYTNFEKITKLTSADDYTASDIFAIVGRAGKI